MLRNKKLNRVTLLLFLISITATSSNAQSDSLKYYTAVQGKLHYGFIFAHSESVQNTAGAHPRGFELNLLRQRVDSTTWDLCRCYPKKGLSISYFNFNSRVLGHGFTTAYFLEPSYKISSSAQLHFRGSIGLSYLTNPYNAVTNPTNMSYSTKMSGFLHLGVGSNYRLTKRLILNIDGNYQHISNGGFKDPNKGINWPTASLGITYFPETYALPVYKQRYEKDLKSKKAFIEAGLFFSAKQGIRPGGQTPRTLLTGLLTQLEKQVGRVSALNAGVEFYFDNALKQKLQVDSAKGSAFRAGLLAGHDFLLGKFFFSQQLGVYLYQRNPYFDRIYHRWTIRYQLREKFLIGIGFNAHRQVADFIDLRLLYHLPAK